MTVHLHTERLAKLPAGAGRSSNWLESASSQATFIVSGLALGKTRQVRWIVCADSQFRTRKRGSRRSSTTSPSNAYERVPFNNAVVDRDLAVDDRARSHGGPRRLPELAGPAWSRPGVNDSQLNWHYTEQARPRSDFLNTTGQR